MSDSDADQEGGLWTRLEHEPHRLSPEYLAEQKRLAAVSDRDPLKKLYRRDGGPVCLGYKLSMAAFTEPCHRFKLDRVLDEVIGKDLPGNVLDDEVTLRRHWPYVALAANLYSSERRDHSHKSLPKPSEIDQLFSDISSGSASLVENLMLLSQWSLEPTSSEAKHREGHLFWLDLLISQSIAGPLREEPEQAPIVQLKTIETRRGFEKTLVRLSVAAKEAQHRLDKKILNRSGRQLGDPALYNLVGRAAQIWESLTNKAPSISKVQSRHDDGMGDRPPFVRFVCRIANMAIEGACPTTAQVSKAYNRYRDRK